MKEREKIKRSIIKQTAPGTALRQGLDNVLKANTGGLIVIGGQEVLSEVSIGGFKIDAPYTPAHLYELAKMDGAILLQPDNYRIMAANVHLVPDSRVPSKETGIRHRSAEQIARQTDALVISISQRRNVISLYKGDIKVVLAEPSQILIIANQALQTLEKYCSVLDVALKRLSVGEFDGAVLLMDVLQAIQRAELVARIEQELRYYIIQLGVEGRLLKMQIDELTRDIEEEERHLIRDYMAKTDGDVQGQIDKILKKLRGLSSEELFNRDLLTKLLGLKDLSDTSKLEYLETRGYRLLNQIPRLPSYIIENVIAHFEDFSHLVNATAEDLDAVEGVGEKRSQQIYVGLKRLRSQTIEELSYI